MTRDDLEQLREGWDFEAKLAGGRDGRGAIPSSFWETYCAMANTFGGRVLLGVRELPDGSLEPVGIEDVEKVERDLWSMLGDRTNVSANLLTRDMVTRVEVDGVTLLQVDIPKATRAQRPVYRNGSLLTDTYVRVNDGDHKADAETVRRMLADADPSRDSKVLDGYGFDDFDEATVRRYRAIFVARRAMHAFSGEDGIEFLRRVRAWGKNRENGTEGPTRAGLLMFGRESSIRDLYPHWHLSYQEHAVDVERWADRVAPDGTWEANVFTFYTRVVDKLLAGVKTPFALDGLYRTGETAVHRALREAFVNCLVHADYAGPTGIRVIRRPGGYEFKNPGLPLVPIEQVWKGGASESRNPTMLHLFTLIELGEREGSGGPAIRDAWRAQHWTPPVLRPDLDLGETHLVLGQGSLLPPEFVDELTEQWGTKFTALDEVGRVALATAHAEGRVSHARLRELTELHSRDLTLKLQELVRLGMLEPMGKGTGRSYRLLSAPLQSQAELWGERAQSAGLAGQRLAESGERSAESGPRSAESDQRLAELAGTDPRVARVASARWTPAAEMKTAILAVCRGQFRTVAEIAAALRRSPRGVREHLAALVGDGALELEFPEKVNHPKQAYRARGQEGLDE